MGLAPGTCPFEITCMGLAPGTCPFEIIVFHGLETSFQCTFSVHMLMPHALKQYISFLESCL
jgi:hypothetical protein